MPCMQVCFFGLFFAHLALGAVDEELSTIAKKLVMQLEQKSLKRIAITEFVTLSGERTGATKFLTDQLTINLVSEAKRFDVIDRANIDSLLQEHKLSQTGLLDQDTVRKLGKFAGVDAVLVGVATQRSSSVNLSIKVLDVETAAIRAALSINISVLDLGDIGTQSPTAQGMMGTPGRAQLLRPNNQVAGTNPSFSNEFVHIEIESIGTTAARNAITLSLSIQNVLASEPFSIAVRDTSWLKVIDNHGQEWSAQGSGGSITDIPGWTKISAGQKTYINARLVPNGYQQTRDQGESVVISLTGNLYKFGAEEQAIVDQHPQKPAPRVVHSFSEAVAAQDAARAAQQAANGRPFTFGISNVVVQSGMPRLGFTLKAETTASDLARVKSPYGLLVEKVEIDGAGRQAGVQAGDILEKFDGTPIRTKAEVDRILRMKGVGTLLLVLNRSGVRLELPLRLTH